MQLRLIRVGLALAGNALGLLITSLILDDDMDVSGAAFVVAVVIFTILTLVLEPVVSSLAEKYVDYLAGASALVSTALALALTDWLSDGMSIDGIGTWVLATLLVWVMTAIVGFVLGRIVLARFSD